MLFPTHRLGVRQASPHPSDLRASKKLLSYTLSATLPNAHTTFYPSQMRLIIHTDGSHLSEPHSRSKEASVEYLSSKGDPLLAPLNGVVDTMSTIIPVVCGSAHETEYGTYYLAGQRAINTRNTLEDIGYPQPTTPIICDNRTASGVANNEIREKRSKSMYKIFTGYETSVTMAHSNSFGLRANSTSPVFLPKPTQTHTTAEIPFCTSMTDFPGPKPQNSTMLLERVC